MEKLRNLLKVTVPFILMTVFLAQTGCENDVDSEFQNLLVATPLKMSLQDFRESGDIIPPRPILESGKIYVYGDLVFVNDKNAGVHIIDNSVRARPVKVAYLEIPANVDISVKNDFLYADSLMDLLVFDISDINSIRLVNRLENVLAHHQPIAEGAEWFDWEGFDYNTEVVVGWEMERKNVRIPEPEVGVFEDMALANAAAAEQVGQGGSLARFKIVADYLYAVDSHNINIIDISDLSSPQDKGDVFAGFDIETIFNQGDHLFLGSMRGMYIYDITNAAQPSLVSEFQHGTACDPVVVDGDMAYITLRGGNLCGATESGLFVVDVSDLQQPVQIAQYPMDEPYGLGVKDNLVFVCDGTSGLRILQGEDPKNLTQIQHIENINTFDVIPTDKSLLIIGDGTLYQYRYTVSGIEPLSVLELD
ncbi:LVIVD repeat-containing protein [Sediminicola luteus]|uniref:LVIVD repeat-containing protein n=1 Tax=Sediminicola luteus TaxID=319238 RepID=A0A2A4GDK8_9FLAO|nr:hypothetical protein [Sediminicola luteus]PCE65842.1 hypothetical protein B7P33_00630 [Sediminicola luteus]